MAETARAFRAMAETAVEGHCRHAPDGTITWASAAMETLLGYPLDELVGLAGGAIVVDKPRPIRDAAYRRLREEREPVTVEAPLPFHRDGSHRWMEMSLRGAFDGAGELLEVHSSRRDISERREANRLRDQWEQTFAHTLRGIVVTDPRDDTIQSLNPALGRNAGWERVRTTSACALTSLVTEASRHAAAEMRREVAAQGHAHAEAGGTSSALTARRSRPMSKQSLPASADGERALPDRLRHGHDRPARAGRPERRAHRRFERAFSDAPIGMALVALEGRWMRVNRSLQIMLGYEEKELLGKTFQDITHPDDLDADLAHVRRLDGDIEGYDMEKRYFTASGELIWVLLSVSLVRDDDGKPEHFISQIMDIPSASAESSTSRTWPTTTRSRACGTAAGSPRSWTATPPARAATATRARC